MQPGNVVSAFGKFVYVASIIATANFEVDEAEMVDPGAATPRMLAFWHKACASTIRKSIHRHMKKL